MNFIDLIKNVAPMLAGTLLGPFGGMAAKALIDVLPGDHQAPAQAALGEGPEAFLAHIGELFTKGAISTADIKKAEMAHAERMAELGYKNAADLAKISADDRDSARRREETVKDATPAALAYLITAGFFGILGWILAYGVPKQGGDALLLLLGSLGTAWTGIMAYYFGSSSGSKDKDATLAEIAKTP